MRPAAGFTTSAGCFSGKITATGASLRSRTSTRSCATAVSAGIKHERSADLLPAFAEPIPVTVIADLPGAPSARPEREPALPILFERLPGLRLACRPRYADRHRFRGLDSLPGAAYRGARLARMRCRVRRCMFRRRAVSDTLRPHSS